MNKYLWISLIGGLILFRPKQVKARTTLPAEDSPPAPNSPVEAPFMISPVHPAIVRNDSAGGGCYLCSRGSRKHNGVDLKADEYAEVVSPIDAIMSRHLTVYKNDKKYIGCELIGTGRHSGLKIKLFYMVPSNYVNQPVRQGEYIGYMQSINDKYPGQGMLDHLHMEVFLNGVRVNPENYLNLISS